MLNDCCRNYSWTDSRHLELDIMDKHTLRVWKI